MDYDEVRVLCSLQSTIYLIIYYFLYITHYTCMTMTISQHVIHMIMRCDWPVPACSLETHIQKSLTSKKYLLLRTIFLIETLGNCFLWSIKLLYSSSFLPFSTTLHCNKITEWNGKY